MIERRCVERNPIINKMLIIDDNLGMVNLLKKVLSTITGQIDYSLDAEHALIQMFQNSGDYNCVILDLKLPGEINGLHLLPDIKTSNPQADIYVVTGYAEEFSEELKNLRLNSFITGYFEKPLNISDFRAEIMNRFIEIKSRLKKLQCQT